MLKIWAYWKLCTYLYMQCSCELIQVCVHCTVFNRMNHHIIYIGKFCMQDIFLVHCLCRCSLQIVSFTSQKSEYMERAMGIQIMSAGTPLNQSAPFANLNVPQSNLHTSLYSIVRFKGLNAPLRYFSRLAVAYSSTWKIVLVHILRPHARNKLIFK